MKIKFLFSLAVLAILFTSCTKNDATPNPEMSPNETVTEPISQDGITFMETLSFNLEDAELITAEYPDGTSEEVYLVEGDIMIPKKKYEEITNPENEAELRQWYGVQTVNNWVGYHVLGYNANNSFGLSNNMQTAMAWAVWNYNNLNIGLSFTYSYGSTASEIGNADIVVYRNGQGVGGSAGPPSGGLPYKWVILQNGLSNANINTIEHIITHEIAHCLGMRHNDWWSRSSCGQNVSEGGTAIVIPGTPWGEDNSGNGSLFNACYPSVTDGEFNFYDRRMMEYLY